MEDIIEQYGMSLLYILAASAILVLLSSFMTGGGVLQGMAKVFMDSICG